jgi:hypothetical protein
MIGVPKKELSNSTCGHVKYQEQVIKKAITCKEENNTNLNFLQPFVRSRPQNGSQCIAIKWPELRRCSLRTRRVTMTLPSTLRVRSRMLSSAANAANTPGGSVIIVLSAGSIALVLTVTMIPACRHCGVLTEFAFPAPNTQTRVQRSRGHGRHPVRLQAAAWLRCGRCIRGPNTDMVVLLVVDYGFQIGVKVLMNHLAWQDISAIQHNSKVLMTCNITHLPFVSKWWLGCAPPVR